MSSRKRPQPGQGRPGASIFAFALLGVALLLVVGWPSPAAARLQVPLVSEPQWGSDIRVSPIFTDTREKNNNFSMAIDPTNSNHVLTGWEYSGIDHHNPSYAWSTDGGSTWPSTGEFRDLWDGDLTPTGNPNVEFDASGTAFYTGQAFGSN